MTHNYVQGNGHKVTGTQEIYERVAEICNKYGIEFEDKMLRYDAPSIYSRGGYCALVPFRGTLTAPGQIEGYGPTIDFGMMKYDYQDDWHGYNCDKEDFEDNVIAAFDEIAVLMSEVKR